MGHCCWPRCTDFTEVRVWVGLVPLSLLQCSLICVDWKYIGQSRGLGFDVRLEPKSFFFLFLQGCKKLLIVLEPFESVNKIWQKTCCYKLEILYDFVHLLCIFYCGVQKHESTGVFDELQYLTGETKSCAISIKINFIL